MGPHILAVVDDLILYSKIKAVAEQLGLSVERTTPGELAGPKTNRRWPLAIIVDLTHYGARGLTVTARGEAGPFLIGIAGHLETELIRKARDAGWNEILVRSMLAVRLPQILSDLKGKL